MQKKEKGKNNTCCEILPVGNKLHFEISEGFPPGPLLPTGLICNWPSRTFHILCRHIFSQICSCRHKNLLMRPSIKIAIEEVLQLHWKRYKL